MYTDLCSLGSQQSNQIADLGGVPDYIKTEAKTIAEKIINITGDGAIPFIMGLGADLHNDDTARYIAGIQGVNEIHKIVPVDLFVFGGDYCNNYTTATGSKIEAQDDLTVCRSLDSLLKMDSVWLQGNHDSNGYPDQRLSREERYLRTGRVQHSLKGFIENTEDPYGCYGYMDFENNKLRVIFVNTSDNDNFGIGTPAESTYVAPLITAHNIGGAQLQWIADKALNFDDKENASDWGVLFVSHLQIYHGTNSWYNSTIYTDDNGDTWDCNLINLANMAIAYRDKTSFSATNNDVVVSKDFTQLTNQATILGFVNGHGHAQTLYTYNDFNFITCPSMNNSAKESDDGNTYTKTEVGTTDETSVSIIVVDRKNNKIYVLVYGAGSDRVINLSTTDDSNEEETTSTNLIDIVGYSDNTRLSTSNGGTKTQEGYVTTGLINVTDLTAPVTIKTSGVDFSQEYSAYCLYNADGTAIGSNILMSDFINSGEGTLDDDGNLTFTISSNRLPTYGIFKLCGYGSGANLIVTANE